MNLLRMRTPFFNFVTSLGLGNCYEIVLIAP
jgi:hypothetical protein